MSVHKSAVISACKLYRYELRRVWNTSLPLLGALWLNPSTADAEHDDNSLTRGIGFTERAGYGGLVLCNPFGYRATNFRDLLDSSAAGIDVIGSENDSYIVGMANECKNIFCGWGSNAEDRLVSSRVSQVLGILNGARLWHLGLTKGGHPKHPLYLKSETTFSEWKP